jgi:RNA polymerase sigma factor (sigma-70 family)
VLGVSLRALRQRQDAEDCFQATFMVLARKAGVVAWQESIVPWLHQVATRIAAETRTRAARRLRHERQTALPVSQSNDDVGLRDLAAAVDSEIQRLPERLRGPLLLCYLQGLTRDQAAQALGWSLRTLERRLQDGRSRLETNLLRRGIGLSAALAAWGLASVADAAVRATLAADTAGAACSFATAGVPGGAGELAAHGLRVMAWEKLRWAVACVVAVVGLCSAAVAATWLSSACWNAPEQPTPQFESVMLAEEDGPMHPIAAKKMQEVSAANAVHDGLRWLVRTQQADGSWQFDAGQPNDVAATALALLPLLEASEGPAFKGPYKDAVQRGLTHLVRRQKADGSFDGGMYAHGIAAWALCEGYHRGGNPAVKKAAQQAIDFIVSAQHEQGGWRYAPRQPGDTSVSTWHIIALHHGKQAGLKVPPRVFTRASDFLDKVASDEGSAYSYMPHARATSSMTAGGLYCRMLLGWGPDHAAVQKGAVHLLKDGPDAKVSNAYYYHFATQAMQSIGGSEWERWEDRMASLLLQRQEHGGVNDGSWPVNGDIYGRATGRHFVTSLSLLALQPCGRFESPAVPHKLTPAETANQWLDLRSDNFAKIRPAMRLLVGAPDRALPLLREHLRPSKAGDPKVIDPLVADLGSSVFARRQRAVDQLKAIGEPAISSLRKSLDNNKLDLEHRRRIESLLELATALPQSPDRLQELRGLQVLELMGTPEARALIAELAKGAPGIGLTDAASESLRRLGK